MEVIYQTALLRIRIESLRKSGRTIGFVPTMGALHEGHLSLVRICRQQNDFTVVSIFVNPTQFNDKADLERYPRMPDNDLALLKSTGCDLVFMPGENGVYPEPDTRVFDFGELGSVMEGKHRPGHFNGVAQVVTRLFELVNPHRAYFGLKDFQQLAIIRKVTSDLNIPVEIVSCPIVRECDGLAMSSRNMLLGPEDRKRALVLSQSLFQAKEMKVRHSPAEVKDFVTGRIQVSPGVDLEYFEIIDGLTLLPVNIWDDRHDVIGCIAARVGNVRLIDNINFSS
jgi:pantoate--beta-alanine ligase